MENKVVSRKNLPSSLPILTTAVIYLLLDKFHVSDVIWGAFGVIVVLMWVGALVSITKQNQVNPFKKENQEN